MSAGRQWDKELYVGFLLLVLSFLYLSHLNAEIRRAEHEDAAWRAGRQEAPIAVAKIAKSASFKLL